MRRRTVITGLTTGLLGTAGCLGETAPTADTSSPDSAPRPTTTSAPTSSSELSITETHTYPYAVRLNNLGTSPGGSIPRVESLPDREEEVVQDALDGGYETESAPAWLADFLGEATNVREGSNYYRLNGSLPTTTITATPADRDTVSGRIASYEEYETAVTHDGLIRTGLLRCARQDGVELTYVWPSLQSFLDSYAAVEYRGSLLSLSVTTTDPGPPYTVTATPATLSELAGEPVWRLSTAPRSLREFVHTAASESGLYAFDSPPGEVLTRLREHRYVYADGEFHTTYVEQAGTPPITMQATLDPQAADSGTAIRFTLRNDLSRSVRITSGAPSPFGVVSYREQGAGSRAGVLWSPAYEDSEDVQTDGREIVSVNSIALLTTISANGSTSRSFQVDPGSLAPGEYVVEDSVGYETGDDSGTVPYSVEFTVFDRTRNNETTQ